MSGSAALRDIRHIYTFACLRAPIDVGVMGALVPGLCLGKAMPLGPRRDNSAYAPGTAHAGQSASVRSRSPTRVGGRLGVGRLAAKA